MKVQVVSFRANGKGAEIVVKGNDNNGKGTSETRHVVLGDDGKYHWRGPNNAGKDVYKVYELVAPTRE